MSARESQALPGWLKAAFAAPNALYDKGFGRILGRRFLRLGHTGRRSGRPFHVVLEVVRYDRANAEAVVVSGFGRRADWFRNLQAGGPLTVDFGRGPRPAAYRVLDVEEAVTTYAAYERRTILLAPLIRPTLTALLGWRYDGSPAARRRLAEQLPLVALTPVRPPERLGTPTDRQGSFPSSA